MRKKTPKENVKSAIHFTRPDRLPVMFDVFGNSDVYRVNWNQKGAGDRAESSFTDEWGCIWKRADDKNMGLVKGHPLEDILSLDSYEWLNPDAPEMYNGMEQRFPCGEDKYVLTGIRMLLFERLHSLRGFEAALEDMYLDPDRAELLIDKIADIQISIIKNIQKRFADKIDGIFFTDDWGTERQLFINPKLWQKIFKPRYKKIFDACKRTGWDVWMHSCGNVESIISLWAECGMDVINLQQPLIFDFEAMKRHVGEVCFMSNCDIQKTLPLKNDKEIEKEAVWLMEKWGTEKGGFIASDYGDGSEIGVPVEKMRVMYEAFKNNDRWENPFHISGLD